MWYNINNYITSLCSSKASLLLNLSAKCICIIFWGIGWGWKPHQIKCHTEMLCHRSRFLPWSFQRGIATLSLTRRLNFDRGICCSTARPFCEGYLPRHTCLGKNHVVSVFRIELCWDSINYLYSILHACTFHRSSDRNFWVKIRAFGEVLA